MPGRRGARDAVPGLTVRAVGWVRDPPQPHDNSVLRQEWVNTASPPYRSKGARMGKRAKASRSPLVGPDARVTGDAEVGEQARVLDHGRVSGRGRVAGRACIKDRGRVAGQAEVRERAVVSGNAWVYENALIKGSAEITDNACVFGDAVISGDARIGGFANVGPRARIKQSDHVVVYGPGVTTVKLVDPRNDDGPDVWTAYRTRKDGVRVMLGRRRKKLADAPEELLKLVTWTKV